MYVVVPKEWGEGGHNQVKLLMQRKEGNGRARDKAGAMHHGAQQQAV